MKFLAIFILALATASAFETAVPFRDVPNDESEGRIIGGSQASDGQFPYQAGLSISGAWCGGSLISSTWVLTAAHCVDGKTSATVYLGSVARTGGTSRTGSVVRHSGYNSQTLANDIALVKIQSVAFSSYIRSIPLPARSGSYSTYVGNTGVISGWGKTSDSSGVASRLMYASVPIISNSDCQRTYGSTVYGGVLCVSTSNGRSTCNGDSGGPIAVNGVLVGATSFGSGAGCAKGYPAAFTRVTYFRDWIYSNTGI